MNIRSKVVDEAFQLVHHVSFILCYTILQIFLGLRCRFGRCKATTVSKRERMERSFVEFRGNKERRGYPGRILQSAGERYQN